MFGFSNKDKECDDIAEVHREVTALKLEVISLRGLIEESIQNTIQNREAIELGTTIVEVEKIVKRKKPRERLRTSSGWKMITPEEKAEFEKLFDEGFSMIDISMRTGRSASAIGKYLHSIKDGTKDEDAESNETQDTK